MRYLLSEEEYQKLKEKGDLLDEMPSKEELQKFCTEIADNMILTSGWRKGNAWGCILSTDEDEEWYCDDCPSQKICPYEWKSWSK